MDDRAHREEPSRRMLMLPEDLYFWTITMAAGSGALAGAGADDFWLGHPFTAATELLFAGCFEYWIYLSWKRVRWLN